jgi:hypothetical protein
MKYRTKPLVVEAEQFFHGQDPDTYPECIRWDAEMGAYFVDTKLGRKGVGDGDWIITDEKGEKCPCKPDVFKAFYEPA